MLWPRVLAAMMYRKRGDRPFRRASMDRSCFFGFPRRLCQICCWRLYLIFSAWCFVRFLGGMDHFLILFRDLERRKRYIRLHWLGFAELFGMFGWFRPTLRICFPFLKNSVCYTMYMGWLGNWWHAVLVTFQVNWLWKSMDWMRSFSLFSLFLLGVTLAFFREIDHCLDGSCQLTT